MTWENWDYYLDNTFPDGSLLDVFYIKKALRAGTPKEPMIQVSIIWRKLEFSRNVFEDFMKVWNFEWAMLTCQ